MIDFSKLIQVYFFIFSGIFGQTEETNEIQSQTQQNIEHLHRVLYGFFPL